MASFGRVARRLSSPPPPREKFRFRGTKKGELNFPITYLRSPESSRASQTP